MIEVQFSSDGANDGCGIEGQEAKLVRQAVQKSLTLGNVAEAFNLQGLGANGSCELVRTTHLHDLVIDVLLVGRDEELPGLGDVHLRVVIGGHVALLGHVHKNVPSVFLGVAVTAAVLVLEELSVRSDSLGQQAQSVAMDAGNFSKDDNQVWQTNATAKRCPR